ncbi:MAG: hypothetical protein IPF81_03260 [Bacteroidetes bacterium]|nr:hypothetical protein [Bacteroidota bacterium]
MDISFYPEIKKKYGSKASWAVWNPADLTDTSVIESKDTIEQYLNTDCVIVGLNKSKDIDEINCWSNFHSASVGDKRLMSVFNEKDKKFHGAYMTDLLYNVTGANSNEIFSYHLKVRNSDEAKALKMKKDAFVAELNFVKVKSETNFILLGSIVHDYFDLFTEFKYLNKIFLPHFSQFTGKDGISDWREYAKRELNGIG